MRTESFRLERVKLIPAKIEPGVFYFSEKYATSMHLCACGCGSDISLAISSAGWKVTKSSALTLRPSVGNWSYPCRSHYLITDGRVEWANAMSAGAISMNRQRDDLLRDAVYSRPEGSFLHKVWQFVKRLIGK